MLVAIHKAVKIAIDHAARPDIGERRAHLAVGDVLASTQDADHAAGQLGRRAVDQQRQLVLALNRAIIARDRLNSDTHLAQTEG